MIKSGEKTPTLSNLDKNHWLQVRQSDGTSRDKLYGLLATGEWQAAIEESKKLLEKSPGDTPILLALASAYGIGHNYEMANFYAGLVLKADPGNSDAMNISGLRIMLASQNHRGDYEDALTWFRKASDNDNTHVAALLNMGYLQLELGDAAGASDAFSLAQSRCNQCYSSTYGLGIASSRTGAWTKAKSSFEQILSNDSSQAEAQYQLALVFKNGLNDQERAMKLLQEIVSDADGRFKNKGPTKRVANPFVELKLMIALDQCQWKPLCLTAMKCQPVLINKV